MQVTGTDAAVQAVRVTNAGGASPFVIVCDHASNALPSGFDRLGLTAEDFTRHIAWDPGALPVAQRLAAALDAALIESCVSRLIIDCNRPLEAHDLVPALSETTVIPGNENLSPAERERRISVSWRPFHDTISALVEQRVAAGRDTWLVSIHSFTPVYKGFSRPWQIGIIHDDDTRLAAPMIAALQRHAGLTVGVNEPYSPADRVYYTLERHARSRGLPCAMIEIRNDEIRDQPGQKRWAEMLAGLFAGLVEQTEGFVRSQPIRLRS